MIDVVLQGLAEVLPQGAALGLEEFLDVGQARVAHAATGGEGIAVAEQLIRLGVRRLRLFR